jgi:hypothetical protein
MISKSLGFEEGYAATGPGWMPRWRNRVAMSVRKARGTPVVAGSEVFVVLVDGVSLVLPGGSGRRPGSGR